MKVNIKNKDNIKEIISLILSSDERLFVINVKPESIVLIKLLFDSNWLELYTKDDIIGDLRHLCTVRLGVIKSFITNKLNS